MSDLHDKISDNGLRAVAESGDANRRVEVIIELDLPPTAAPPGHVRTRNGPHVQARSLVPDSEEPFDPHDAEMDLLERDIRALRPADPPVRLRTAQAFAVTLTGAQLRAATRLSRAGAIRPSRTHHA